MQIFFSIMSFNFLTIISGGFLSLCSGLVLKMVPGFYSDEFSPDHKMTGTGPLFTDFLVKELPLGLTVSVRASRIGGRGLEPTPDSGIF